MSTHRILIIILLALNAIAFAGIQGWLGGPPPRTEPERLAQQLDPERIRLASDPPASAAPATGASTDTAASTPEAPADTTAEADAAEIPPLSMEPDSSADTAAAEAPAAETVAAETPRAEAAAPETPSASQAAVTPPVPTSCVAWSDLSEAQADALMRQLRNSGASAERRKIETPSSWWVRVPPQGSREQAEEQARALRALGVRDLFIVQERGPAQYAISLGVFQTEARARQMLAELRAQGVRNAGVAPRMSTAHRIQAQLTADAAREAESGVRGLASRRTACAQR
ncbi:SPOR domain-containing protein [Thauera sp. Sel9]|uniref:SPOR domain-containing protein n=1 Tax=Thauera sp. Sel9 TaxID=2974299 RepID=UPI0021E15CCB|nr:SPOR domain-containing protein [Thauera sp. Sel9]MCV2219820.1 SPOR domain-containing protein [Thauera sp. Sel9]